MGSKLTFVILSPITIKAETLVYDSTNPAPDTIECKDASTPCVVNCITRASCQQKEIHCHRTAPQPCDIIINGTSNGRDSFYFTHQSPVVHITANDQYAIFRSVIYAHEAMGSKLYISVDGTWVFEEGKVYAPVGEESLLYIDCFGGDGCYNMRIYDDWTTEVHLVSRITLRITQVRNIFDDSPLNISRNDTFYRGLNSAYRAPVFLSGHFHHLKYFGHNHGDWTLLGMGPYDYSFANAEIEATADLPLYKNRSSGYNITLTGNLTATFQGLTLNANQYGANIHVEVRGNYGLSGATIYAKKANSLEIYCKEGGDCDRLTVECPLNNECQIECDDAVDTDCSNMKIYTNDTCSHADVLCDGIHCNFGIDSSDTTKVFCGFNQNETFCGMEYNASGALLCNDYGSRQCSNKYTGAECGESAIAITQTEISSTDHMDIFTSGTLTTIMSIATGIFSKEVEELSTTEMQLNDTTDAYAPKKHESESLAVLYGVIIALSLALLCSVVYHMLYKRKKEREVKEIENMAASTSVDDADDPPKAIQNTIVIEAISSVQKQGESAEESIEDENIEDMYRNDVVHETSGFETKTYGNSNR